MAAQQQPQVPAAAGAGEGGADAAAQAKAEAFHAFDNWSKLHATQLRDMNLPEHLWKSLHTKIYGEQFDATDAFRVEWGDGVGFRLVCNTRAGLKAGANVWLIEHAFTTTADMYKATLTQHPDLVQRLWDMLDLDRRSKFVPPVWSKPQQAGGGVGPSASAAAAAAAGAAGGGGGAAAKDSKTPAAAAAGTGGGAAGAGVDQRTRMVAGEDRGQLTDALLNDMVDQLRTVIVPAPSRDAALKALVAADYDLLTAMTALMPDDAATADLEKAVTAQFEQSVAGQTQYADANTTTTTTTTAPAAAPGGGPAAAAGPAAGPAAAKPAAGAQVETPEAKAKAALSDRIDLLWRCAFKLQDMGSYLIRDPRLGNEVVQCLFVMDQVGCAIQDAAQQSGGNKTAATGANTSNNNKKTTTAANASVAPLCLLTLPDVAYSVLWLTRDVAFDEIVTRDFAPVELVA